MLGANIYMLFLIDLHLIWQSLSIFAGKLFPKKVFEKVLDPIIHVKKIIAGRPTVSVYRVLCSGTGAVPGSDKAS